MENPSVIWIEGDAGFGKTALVRQAVRSLAADHDVITAEADELSRAEPFGIATQFACSGP